MSEMSIQYAALTSAVGDVHHTADQLDQGRTHLHESFASFLGSGWTGGAAESFRDGWDDWSHGVGEVLDALRTIGDLMTEHSKDLQQHDGAVHGSMSGLQSRLGPVGQGY